MEQEKFDGMLEELKSLGCQANIAVFAFSDETKQMLVRFSHDDGDSLTEISSTLAKIFKTVLAVTENQEDKRMFGVLRDAMAAAIIPYINGLSEEQLTALALLGI
jgi:hypothetical protein